MPSESENNNFSLSKCPIFKRFQINTLSRVKNGLKIVLGHFSNVSWDIAMIEHYICNNFIGKKLLNVRTSPFLRICRDSAVFTDLSLLLYITYLISSLKLVTHYGHGQVTVRT